MCESGQVIFFYLLSLSPSSVSWPILCLKCNHWINFFQNFRCRMRSVEVLQPHKGLLILDWGMKLVPKKFFYPILGLYCADVYVFYLLIHEFICILSFTLWICIQLFVTMATEIIFINCIFVLGIFVNFAEF